MTLLRTYYTRLLICLGMALWSITSQAQDTYSFSYKDIPQCFDILDKSRATYNRYNDSIFQIRDRQSWINFFRRRAIKNHQLFETNKVTLNTLFNYFKDNKSTLPEAAYETLYKETNTQISQQTIDPFTLLNVCNILKEHYEASPFLYNKASFVNLWLGNAYISIWSGCKDSLSMSQSLACFKKCYSQATSTPIKFLALRNLVTTIWPVNKLMGIQEFNTYRLELEDMMKMPNVAEAIGGINNYRKTINYLKYLDEGLIRNVYMKDTTIMPKAKADSIMQKYIKDNLSNPNISVLSHQRALLMQVWQKQITTTQALELAMERYRKESASAPTKRLNDAELTRFLTQHTNLFYFIDQAKISKKKKHKLCIELWENIVAAYKLREDQQYSAGYVRLLGTLITYDKAIKYLNTQERIYYLNALTVSTQVTTYAHSVHVSLIAKVLMKGIFKYRPELLVGSLGDLQVTEILKHQAEYLDFIDHAALYHDVGKNAMPGVISNDYRPLTDYEFFNIKRHPALGLNFLAIDPSLKKYHDTTLGHHKWYNGKGGYPQEFDNTKSPKRILIDIVTLADCMQAATEKVGRNYKGDKTFDVVMGEMRRDAGVRYNPDLVELIDEHKDLAEAIDVLVDKGWLDIYYNIYSQFFNPE